jgi:hypothetical protein
MNLNFVNQDALTLKQGKYGHTANYNSEWTELADFFSQKTNVIKDVKAFVQEAKILLADDKKEEVLDLLNQFIAKY